MPTVIDEFYRLVSVFDRAVVGVGSGMSTAPIGCTSDVCGEIWGGLRDYNNERVVFQECDCETSHYGNEGYRGARYGGSSRLE